MTPRAILEAAFAAGVAACKRPGAIIDALPARPGGRVIALAAGKAAIPMAQAVESHWRDLSGLAVTRHDYGGTLRDLAVIEARHPVPDDAGLRAAARMIELAEGARDNDLVLVLLSGGASALLAAPAPGLTLAIKQQLTRALVASGASIGEINCVRRHLSRIKGGRLAASAFPARVLTLAVSDVAGDRAEDIGSGPTVADASTIGHARAVLARYGIAEPEGWSETVKPGDPRLGGAAFRIIVRAEDALKAAGDALAAHGYEPVLLDPQATGEAREFARAHARAAREARAQRRRVALISGGELTVTLTGAGRGGPNQEYALALAIALDGAPGIAALAADTDGVDGSHDVAGGYVDAGTLGALASAGIDPAGALADNDAGGALGAIGALFVPGPTHTNVNDLRMILVEP